MAREILRDCWTPGSPIRALTVTAQNLSPQEDAWEQVNLFQAPDPQARKKQEGLASAMDSIRARYGRSAIGYSGLLEGEESGGTD